MHRRPALLGSLLLLITPVAAIAQKVTIKRATPAEVVAAANAELAPQGFRLEESSEKEARFALDRGMVAQGRGSMARTVPVVLELRLRFRQKPDGLEVSADEEVVGARGQGAMEFRQPVRSRAERDGMQKLLDLIRADLEARPVSDSTPQDAR